MRILLGALAASVLAACSTSSSGTCSPSTCFSGCCDSNGQCQTNDTISTCGTGGNLCDLCIGGQICQAYRCTTVVVDAGPNMVITDGGTMSPVDAGSGVPTAIVAPAEVWSWVDFPDSTCGNGVPTGIAVNLTSKSTDLLIYMQGGGACWESLTCFTIKSADNLESGYVGGDFAADGTRMMPGFNRALLTNPFKDASYVFMPYCTGDVHSGDSERTIAGRDVKFKGAKNVAAYLKRLTLTFPSVTRVFLSGSSAGAFGAQLNFARVHEAFPSAEIHVLADSGQMINPSGTRLADWVTTWNVEVPASCVGCLSDFPKYIDWLSSTYPQSRFALLAYSQDGVLSQFFNYSGPNFETQTDALLSGHFDPHVNTKYFYLSGPSHTMLGSQFTITGPAPANVKLNDFITQWYSGSGSWASVNR